ncbi:MAG: hypothetical protein HN826_01275 [Methylococcales bacterium]|jgi:predicted Zn-dependent protease|nr:hypothetical protein [Methylococcales bacterium]
MKHSFTQLVDFLKQKITTNEQFLLNLSAEESDFVRLNHNKIRQAGHVKQIHLSLKLIQGEKHATGNISLMGESEEDFVRIHRLLNHLRSQLPFLPDDPYLNFSTEINQTETEHSSHLPESQQMIDDIIHTADTLDLVGIFASGTQYQAFANSFGQYNWYMNNNFNFDFSCYLEKDKAVKSGYAGYQWDKASFVQRIKNAKQQLDILKIPEKIIQPGQYRVYLAPSALAEILSMMAWGGFGLKSHKTAQTPLLKMTKENRHLSSLVTLSENYTMGLTPPFTRQGFIKPKQVTLIKQGKYQDCLTSPRSAKEYDQIVNADSEMPSSLELQKGQLKQDDILQTLETGLYINNLWYCNYSDRNEARITGMTRFACFWVENGEIKAPISVMRFDDSIYSMLGNNLLALTQQQDFILDPDTYSQRSTASIKLPGALIENFTLTL